MTINAIIDELRENGREQTFADPSEMPEEAAALREREKALYDEAAAIGYCWQTVNGLLVTLICDSIDTGQLPDGTPGY